MNEVSKRNTEQIATEINSIKEQTQKIMILSSIEIGKRLVEAKALVQHGEWGKWLEGSVNYSQRTANNLMKIYEEYGKDQDVLQGEIDNSQAIAKLNYTQAVALFSIPSDEREAFINEHDLENMSTRDLQQAIKEKKELKKQLEISEANANQEREEKVKFQKQFKELEDSVGTYEDKINELTEELNAAKGTGDEEEIKRLSSSLQSTEKSLEASKKQILELEARLNEKPIENQVVVEKIPEEIQTELELLRKQVLTKTDDDNITKFKIHFDSLVKGFNEILVTLSDIEEQTSSDKFKKAIKGLLEKMQEEL